MNLNPNIVYIILTYGQSNALGIADTTDANDPVLNPSTATKNYKVEWDWTNNVFTLSTDHQIVKSINDNDWNRISPSYYTVEGLDKRLSAAGLPNPVFVNIAAGKGAAAIASLNKGNTYYNKILDAVTFTKSQFPGKTVQVLFIAWIHGESDSYYYADANAYTSLLIQMKNDINTDLAAITGQSARIPFYLNQISWGIGSQAEGNGVRMVMKEVQRELTTQDPELVFCLPTYQLPTAAHDPSAPASAIHFSGYSLLNLGEKLAQTYYDTAIRGGSVQTPNSFFYQKVDSNKLSIRTNSTTGLQIDPSIITYRGQKGFEFYDNSSIEQLISKVEAFESSVLITFTNNIVPGTLYYAYTQPFFVNSVKYMRQAGSVKDNSIDQSLFTGSVLYNYLPSFKMTIS